MLKKSLVSIGVAAALGFACAQAVAAPGVHNRALEVVGAGAVSDPLIAVEANRAAIVNRLVSDHAEALIANGIDAAAFRAALTSLRADQLLAASLVNTVQEVTQIVSQAPANGAALQRFVALTPTVPATMAEVPTAEAYLVRDGDSLSIVKAADMQIGTGGSVLVGYFAPATTSVYSASTLDRFSPKDGSGSGANSWIGYTAGGNVASGSGSAVAAGTFNGATGTNAAIFAGQSNTATGTSSLVIGGFDNHATSIDALVGAGAGNQATAPRSVVIGGGYNLASGPWSFIGGGGRETGSGNAGTSAQDNVAGAKWTAVVGGVGNRATNDGAFVGGGGFNVASGMGSFIGGGSICCSTGSTGSFPNIASGRGSSIVGGYQNTTSAPASFIGGGWLNTASGSYASAVLGGYGNVASGQYSSVLGGYSNIASGNYSVALGTFALTQSVTPTPHSGAFVFSDGQAGNFRSTGNNTFNVLATGGMQLVTAATNNSGEAAPTAGTTLNTSGNWDWTSFNFGQYITGFGVNKGVGAQPNSMYTRVLDGAYWYSGGVHSSVEGDPGSGGSVLATLTNGGPTPAVVGTFRAQVITATSDKNAKTAFESLSPRAILQKVASMPVMLWSYKNETDKGVRHIGPVAQDFSRLFNVGYDDKSIATVDADGVAFAAIQGLKQELDEKNGKIDRLERELKLIKAKLGLK